MVRLASQYFQALEELLSASTGEYDNELTLAIGSKLYGSMIPEPVSTSESSLMFVLSEFLPSLSENEPERLGSLLALLSASLELAELVRSSSSKTSACYRQVLIHLVDISL